MRFINVLLTYLLTSHPGRSRLGCCCCGGGAGRRQLARVRATVDARCAPRDRKLYCELERTEKRSRAAAAAVERCATKTSHADQDSDCVTCRPAAASPPQHSPDLFTYASALMKPSRHGDRLLWKRVSAREVQLGRAAASDTCRRFCDVITRNRCYSYMQTAPRFSS